MISGTEIAFFSLSKTDLDLLSKEHSPAGDRVLGLLNKPKKLLATILIANNFINMTGLVFSIGLTGALNTLAAQSFG